LVIVEGRDSTFLATEHKARVYRWSDCLVTVPCLAAGKCPSEGAAPTPALPREGGRFGETARPAASGSAHSRQNSGFGLERFWDLV